MKRVLLLTAVLAISNSALGADEDVASLQMRVGGKVKLAEAKHLQLTGDDVDNITCTIVSNEMTETGEAIATVADKYQLDPTIARCVQVSSAIIEINALENSGSGSGHTPP